MQLWRLSRHASLDGTGGLKVAGRWHHAGRPVLYTASHPATAVLEVLAHLEVRRPEALNGYRLIELAVPDDAVSALAAELPLGWREAVEVTRAVGDAWLSERATLALRVPSVLVPAADNVLINPRHPRAGSVTVVAEHEFRFDARLLG
jgi:RES domain-containing protein